MYELCRLGRHRPISKDLRNGIIRASKKAAARLVDEPVDEWFTSIGKEKIRLLFCEEKKLQALFDWP